MLNKHQNQMCTEIHFESFLSSFFRLFFTFVDSQKQNGTETFFSNSSILGEKKRLPTTLLLPHSICIFFFDLAKSINDRLYIETTQHFIIYFKQTNNKYKSIIQ